MVICYCKRHCRLPNYSDVSVYCQTRSLVQLYIGPNDGPMMMFSPIIICFRASFNLFFCDGFLLPRFADHFDSYVKLSLFLHHRYFADSFNRRLAVIFQVAFDVIKIKAIRNLNSSQISLQSLPPGFWINKQPGLAWERAGMEIWKYRIRDSELWPL